jgi:hypothetical protein
MALAAAARAAQVMGSSWFRGTVTLGDRPSDAVTAFGSAIVEGDTTMHQALTVRGDTRVRDLFASNVTLSGWLRLRDRRGSVTFSVDPASGNTYSAGVLTVSGAAAFAQSVTVGRKSTDAAQFHGPVALLSSLDVASDAYLEGHSMLDGALTVRGSGVVGGTLRVGGQQQMRVGSGPLDEVVVHGALVLQHWPYTIFSVDHQSGSVVGAGQLRVHGQTQLQGAIAVDGALDVGGEATIAGGAGLHVLGEAAWTGAAAVDVGGRLLLDSTVRVNGSLSARGDVSLGTTDNTEVVLRGALIVQNSSSSSSSSSSGGGGAVKFSADAELGHSYVAGGVRVAGSMSSGASVALGRNATDAVTVHLRAELRQAMQARRDVLVRGQLDLHGQSAEVGSAFGTHGSGDLTLLGDVSLGDTPADVVRLNAHLNISNQAGEVKLSVDCRDGAVAAEGPLEVMGNLDVRGHLRVSDLTVQHLRVDRISLPATTTTATAASNASDVLSIEGVLFRRGRMRWTKAHQLHGLIDDLGVTIEGAHFDDGALRLISRSMAAVDDSTVDVLTLMNTGHNMSMTDMRTPVRFHQVYHAGINGSGGNTIVQSSAVAAGTANNWTANASTHNSYLVCHTQTRGSLTERMRITASGDFRLNFDRVVMRGRTGDMEVIGDVGVGLQPGSRALLVSSRTTAATVQILSGGTSDGKLTLSSTFGGNVGGVSLFQLTNQGNPPPQDGVRMPVLRLSDGVDPLLSLIDRGMIAKLHVSGGVTIGANSSALPHSLHIHSGAAAQLRLQSGQDQDSILRITSGPGRKASLRLVDPAEDGDGATFTLLNDGGDLRLRDTDGYTMLSVVDRGRTGDLMVSGDGVIGSKQSPGNRMLTVQANATAEINVLAGGLHPALLSVTSGPDRRSVLALLDPAAGNAGSRFELFNDGARLGSPGLVLHGYGLGAQQPPQTMFTLVDEGTSSSLVMSGGGHIGGPSARQLRTLTVQSGTGGATVEIKAGPASVARALLTAGAQQHARLVVTNPGQPLNGRSFELFVDGQAPQPTLRITDGLDAAAVNGGAANQLLQLLDTGLYGQLRVTGNGQFGDPSAQGRRSLTVQSAMQSEMRVVSGASAPASIKIVAAVNQNAKLVLQDPGGVDGIVPAGFEILNYGGATLPTLRVTNGEDTLLSLVDRGSSGDLQLTGSALFGGGAIAADRALNVTSGRDAILEAVSALNTASISITAAPDRDARLALSDLGVVDTDSGAYFELLNLGSANVQPQLRVTDGLHTLLQVTDVGDVGALLVTGDSVVGGATATGPRRLTVQSGEGATARVQSGPQSDGVVSLLAGWDKAAKLVLEDGLGPMGGGQALVLFNDGAQNEFATLRLQDGGGSTMLAVRDRGAVGSLEVTGSVLLGNRAEGAHGGCALLGGAATVWKRCGGACVPIEVAPDCAHHLNVRSTLDASVHVTAAEDAVVHVEAAGGRDASVVLKDPGDGTNSPTFALSVDGDAPDATPTLHIADRSGRLLSLISQGSVAAAGDLDTVGDVTFIATEGGAPRTLRVSSGGAASATLGAGPSADASATLRAGPDADAALRFYDPAASNPVFEIVNVGAVNMSQIDEVPGVSLTTGPTLAITDGTNSILNVRRASLPGDAGVQGDLSVAGTLSCGDASLGGMVRATRCHPAIWLFC